MTPARPYAGSCAGVRWIASLVTPGGLLEDRIFRMLEAGRLILVAASLAWVMRAGRTGDARGVGVELPST